MKCLFELEEVGDGSFSLKDNKASTSLLYTRKCQNLTCVLDSIAGWNNVLGPFSRKTRLARGTESLRLVQANGPLRKDSPEKSPN